MKESPTIAVTMGDPAGVGPEICLRLLDHKELCSQVQPIIYGDQCVLDAVAAKLGLPRAKPSQVADWGAIGPEKFSPGEINAATGRAAYRYVEEAIRAAQAGKVSGIATAPINKEALHLAGIPYPGHTEILAAKSGTPRFCMMQYSEILACTFVTVHVGYHEVPELISTERISEVLDLTREALIKIRKREPNLVVLGLNPHAGEHGLFGNEEEERLIEPAIQIARDKGWEVEGPIPPDTAFIPQKRKTTDAFICMYHDQGHIPVKALAFDQAVNTTLGLPFPRTSVDHGTALDIAWQGIADPSSLFAAIRLNALLCGNE